MSHAASPAESFGRSDRSAACRCLPDIDCALEEIEYAFDHRKVEGIGVYTNDNLA